MQSINIFVMKGRISSITQGSGTKRSEFYVNSYILKRDVNIRFLADCEIPEEIAEGDKVIVEGYVSVIPGEPQSEARKRPYQRFFATSIKKAGTEMGRAFGREGTYYTPDYARAFFKGVVVGTKDRANPEWKRMTLLVDGDRTDRFPSRVVLDYHVKKTQFMQLPEYDFKNGDAVQVICEITTTAKEQTETTMDDEGHISSKTKKVHFQNFKVVDIQYTR